MAPVGCHNSAALGKKTFNDNSRWRNPLACQVAALKRTFTVRALFLSCNKLLELGWGVDRRLDLQKNGNPHGGENGHSRFASRRATKDLVTARRTANEKNRIYLLFI